MWGYTPDKIVKWSVLFGYGSEAADSDMTEAERQRQMHIDRGDFGPPPVRNPGTWDTYDPSLHEVEWHVVFDSEDYHAWYMANQGKPETRERDRDLPDYPGYDLDRPDEHDYYWSEPEMQAPDKWEDWARALAV